MEDGVSDVVVGATQVDVGATQVEVGVGAGVDEVLGASYMKERVDQRLLTFDARLVHT